MNSAAGNKPNMNAAAGNKPNMNAAAGNKPNNAAAGNKPNNAAVLVPEVDFCDFKEKKLKVGDREYDSSNCRYCRCEASQTMICDQTVSW